MQGVKQAAGTLPWFWADKQCLLDCSMLNAQSLRIYNSNALEVWTQNKVNSGKSMKQAGAGTPPWFWADKKCLLNFSTIAANPSRENTPFSFHTNNRTVGHLVWELLGNQNVFLRPDVFV